MPPQMPTWTTKGIVSMTDARMSSGLLRILTAVIGAPVVLAATVVGGWYFTALIVAAAIACQIEFYRLGQADGSLLLTILGIGAGSFAVIGFSEPSFFGFALVAVVALAAVYPFVAKGDRVISDLGVLLAGILYPALFLGTLVGIRSSGDSSALFVTALTVVLIWSSDTFAYYTGKSIGKHQLTPISPKKTWEGSIGGLIGAGVVGGLLKHFWIGAALDWSQILLLVIICGVVGQVGDIFESKLKRAANVKDSGSLLPGHGGMLDRLDAVILVSPLVYVLFVHWQVV